MPQYLQAAGVCSSFQSMHGVPTARVAKIVIPLFQSGVAIFATHGPGQVGVAQCRSHCESLEGPQLLEHQWQTLA